MTLKSNDRPNTELHWFPWFPDRWLSSEAVSAMLPEQEGAFFRLLNIMFRAAKDAEPSLPNDDAKLAQMSRLGDRWATLGSAIRDEFELKDGRLINRVLSAVWRDQRKKHAAAVKRARTAGKASGERRANLKRTTSSTPSLPQANHSSLILRESTTLSNAQETVGALAADAPRAPEQRLGGTKRLGDVLPLVAPTRKA